MKAFTLYGRMEVIYNGRACSTLVEGNYLIIYKPDMCISIHGAAFIKPLNYQNPGTKLEFLQTGQEFNDIHINYFSRKPQLIIRAVNKKEELLIAIYKIIQHHILEDWTLSKINLERSERDLVNQIVNNIYDYFPDLDIVLVETEFPTPYGNVDILILDSNNIRHIVEVKRKVVSVAGCGQIARYANYFNANNIQTKEYVSAPAITNNALQYVADNNQQWIKATFDDYKDNK